MEVEGIGFYSHPTQALLKSRSSPNHVQPMLIYRIAWKKELLWVEKNEFWYSVECRIAESTVNPN